MKVNIVQEADADTRAQVGYATGIGMHTQTVIETFIVTRLAVNNSTNISCGLGTWLGGYKSHTAMHYLLRVRVQISKVYPFYYIALFMCSWSKTSY